MTLQSIQGHSRRIDHLSQRTRRVVAVITMLGLPAMYAWSAFWLSTTVSNLIWGPIAFLLIGATLLGAFVLYRYTRQRADLRDAHLDERQRQLRDRAWILAYQVLAVVVVGGIAFAAVAVLGLGQTLTLDASIVSGAAISVGVLLPLLPSAALAWIEPDEPDDL
jgi:hypothetical protein